MVDPTASTTGDENANEESKELALPGFSDADLRNLTDAQSIESLLDGTIHNAADYGNGFSILEDKSRLVNVPIMFLGWAVHPGDHGDFVSAYVAELDKKGAIAGKWIVNDGSMKSGLARQLVDLAKNDGVTRGLFAPNGLRKSDYTYDEIDDKTGEVKKKPATTYYIDLSA
jgi:hypothetical protein